MQTRRERGKEEAVRPAAIPKILTTGPLQKKKKFANLWSLRYNGK